METIIGNYIARILSGPFIIRVPFSYYSVLIRGSENKKGKRVLLRNLDRDYYRDPFPPFPTKHQGRRSSWRRESTP